MQWVERHKLLQLYSSCLRQTVLSGQCYRVPSWRNVNSQRSLDWKPWVDNDQFPKEERSRERSIVCFEWIRNTRQATWVPATLKRRTLECNMQFSTSHSEVSQYIIKKCTWFDKPFLNSMNIFTFILCSYRKKEVGLSYKKILCRFRSQRRWWSRKCSSRLQACWGYSEKTRHQTSWHEQCSDEDAYNSWY